MPFRNDDVASRARIDTLEREVDRLREENEALKAREPSGGTAARPRTKGLPRRLTMALGLLLLVVGWGCWTLVEQTAPGDPIASVALVAAGVALLAIGIVLHVVRTLFVIVPPGELAIVVGRRYVTGGVERGYRVVTGGRAVRLPIIENVEWMSTRLPRRELTLANAFTKGGDRVTVEARAAMEVAADAPLVHRAIERFVGRDPEEIARVAQETIEGGFRVVVARLTVEEIQSDPWQLGRTIVEECQPDMGELGLVLNELEVLSVRSS